MSSIHLNLKKILPKLKGKTWYNQRFDGSPLFLYFMGSADIKADRRKPKNTNGDMGICFFSHGKADWYFDMADIQKGAAAMVRLAKKDPKISTRLLAKWKMDEKTFEEFFWKTFPEIQLTRLSNKELVSLLNLLFKLFTNATSSTSIIDRFALGTDELVGNLLRKEVFTGRTNFRESEFTNIFATLTAPVYQSFINQAEIDLLKIILGKSKVTLKSHQKQYFWTKNNYVTAQILDAKHFKKEIKAWKQSGRDLNVKLQCIQNTPKLNKSKKQALLKKLRLSPLLKALLKISEDFTWWQDERKKFTYYNIHMGTQVLNEVARKTGYATGELKYTLLPEIETILKKQTPSREILRQRMGNSVFVLTKPKSYLFSGPKANRLRKLMLGSKAKQEINDFRGLSASTGRVIGTVKIVKSATEINKVKAGDILVAVMTRPDYIPAMKKAAAIITNEGGITSHAAIVSRELGIPCIIGTKIATEVLKDGDLVEVNANHGWVRKLKE